MPVESTRKINHYLKRKKKGHGHFFFPTEHFYWLSIIWEFHIMTLIVLSSQSSQIRSPTLVKCSPFKKKKKKLPNLCSPYAHWVFSSPRRFPNRTENYPVLPNNQIPNSAICWAQSLGWKKESHQVWLLSHHLPCNVLGRVSKRDVELESKPHLLTHLRQHRGPASPQG